MTWLVLTRLRTKILRVLFYEEGHSNYLVVFLRNLALCIVETPTFKSLIGVTLLDIGLYGFEALNSYDF